MDSLITALAQHTELIAPFAARLQAWLCKLHLYPALVEQGLLSRRGFAREFIDRCYERLNPAPWTYRMPATYCACCCQKAPTWHGCRRWAPSAVPGF
jgi:hypothetical protein